MQMPLVAGFKVFLLGHRLKIRDESWFLVSPRPLRDSNRGPTKPTLPSKAKTQTPTHPKLQLR